MKLTVWDLVTAIQSARNLEKLQADLRNAMIKHLIEQSPTPVDTTLSGAPNLNLLLDSAIARTG